MGFNLTVKVDGDTQISRMITNVTDLPKDLSEQFKEVGEVVYKAISNNFEAEGRGGQWQELAPRTIAERVYAGYGAGPIGIRTGEMIDSLTGDGDNTIREINEQSASFGAAGVKVASFHKGRSGQPARNVLYLSDKDKNDIVAVFRKAVKSTLSKSAKEFFGGK